MGNEVVLDKILLGNRVLGTTAIFMGVNFVGAESSGILGSVGHKVNIHKINPATGKERGDLERLRPSTCSEVVLQKP